MTPPPLCHPFFPSSTSTPSLRGSPPSQHGFRTPRSTLTLPTVFTLYECVPLVHLWCICPWSSAYVWCGPLHMVVCP